MSTNPSSPPLRIGGVPEHFNYPWKIAQSIDKLNTFQFIEQKLGTGEMLTNLKSKKLDIIIGLTEGIITDIINGNNIKCIGTYVETPLCWAISIANNATINTIDELKDKKFGISRYNSGSHLMTYVLANQRGWNMKDITFDVKDAFMWETYTTKPYHDSHEIKRLGDITTPWPCFMIAALTETITDRLEDIQKLMSLIQESCNIFVKEYKTMPEIISKEYGLKLEDAQSWYKNVRISAIDMVSEAALERTISTLIDTNVVPADSNIDDLELYIDTRICELRRDIKSMKLYSRPELIKGLYGELRNANLARGKINYTDLLSYDQNHYNGTIEIDNTIREIGLSNGNNVINIGSGLGGPARYMAGKYRLNVLAIELQDDLNSTASELTDRCQLENVTHIAGDFLQVSRHLPENHFEAICSWNTILHIIDRKGLFSKCARVLKPNGKLFAADFFAKNPFTKDERKTLSEDVWCKYLPNEDCYKRDITSCGFKIDMWNDCTEEWKGLTAARAASFAANKERNISVLGKDAYEGLLYFYTTIEKLFTGGNLGGIRYIASKE